MFSGTQLSTLIPNGMLMGRASNTLLIEPPSEDLVVTLARRIHGGRTKLQEEILDQLAGNPKRYADLQALLRGRNTNVLNKALRALLDEGLLDQYGDPQQKPPATRYHLNSLGVAVRDGIVELRFAERIQAAVKPLRAGAAA